jgi:hypothetical protein
MQEVVSVSRTWAASASFFTPIVNAPEVAILGISARMEPVYNKDTGQFVPRLMLPLSLSYDHRVTGPTASASCAGSLMPLNSPSCSRFKDDHRRVGRVSRSARWASETCQPGSPAPPAYQASYELIQVVVVGGRADSFSPPIWLSVAIIDPEAKPGGVCVYRAAFLESAVARANSSTRRATPAPGGDLQNPRSTWRSPSSRTAS